MSDADFRWQAFFQRSTEPLFVLNRQRYLLFVNRALETLTGLPAAQLKRIHCAGRTPPAADADWRTILGYVLAPSQEVLAGEPASLRRLIPPHAGSGARWWDIDFLPLADADGFRGLLGKITPGPEATGPVTPLLPESVVNLRKRVLANLGQVYLGGRIPSLRKLADQARVAAQNRSSVAIVGGPGSGKKTVARLIHYRGLDREKAFAVLDCRRLPPFAVGAMLWGESGAAARAPVGTVFLNEPAVLPRELQERLLRWLVPATGVDLARPRLLTGWRDDPAEAVRDRRLLEELYHALTTLRLDVPDLRQRRDDLPHLVDRMLQRLTGGGGPTVEALTADAWEIVLAYAWPGNLRELYRTLRDASRRATGGKIDAADLPAYVRQVVQVAQMPSTRSDDPVPIRSITHEVEKRLVQLALKRARGNKRRAAKLLDVHPPWLYKRLHELGLVEKEEAPAEEEQGEP